jgi:hypothetical protein
MKTKKRSHPQNSQAADLVEEEAAHELGSLVGTTTGGTDRDTVAGGWEGTDDATSTAPSDLSRPILDPDELDTDIEIDRLYSETKMLGEEAQELPVEEG